VNAQEAFEHAIGRLDAIAGYLHARRHHIGDAPRKITIETTEKHLWELAEDLKRAHRKL
jgi:hypothetical protein